MEFRGRFYPIPNNKNAQGTELAKALFIFKEGGKIKFYV
jgi:DNA-directed RNA polymerase